MRKIEISINIPVYNTAKYLRQLIASIQNQTFKDFEAIFVDDGSTDDSVEIIRSYDDPRFRVIELSKNHGVSRALNVAADSSTGKYLLIMGSDDLMHPQLLEKQRGFMESNSDIDVCGVSAQLFGEMRGLWVKPQTDSEIVAGLLFRATMMHPGVIIRKEMYERSECRYDETLSSAVDYDLWRQMIGKMKFHNLQEVLLYYRRHTSQMSTAGVDRQNKNASIVRMRMFREYFSNLTKEEVDLINLMIINDSDACSPLILKDIDSVFNKMIDWQQSLFDRYNLIDLFAMYITTFIISNKQERLVCCFALMKLNLFKSMTIQRKIRLILRVIKRIILHGKS